MLSILTLACILAGYAIGRPIGRAVQSIIDRRAMDRAILARNLPAYDRAYFGSLAHRGIITKREARYATKYPRGI